MSGLIPTITISDFKKLKVHQLKELSSCEVFSDGEYLFTYINGHQSNMDYVRTQAEYLGLKPNTLGGKALEELLEAVSA